jgi:hypothetical protein
MKAIFSNKTINYILIVTILPYLIAGLSTSAHADNKSALKDAIGLDDKVKVSEVKTGEIKAADTKPADAMSKAPGDLDFKRLDGNGDGKLSLKEAVKDKALAAQFDTIDVNHDGMIEMDEYANYKSAPTAKTTDPSAATPVTN